MSVWDCRLVLGVPCTELLSVACLLFPWWKENIEISAVLEQCLPLILWGFAHVGGHSLTLGIFFCRCPPYLLRWGSQWTWSLVLKPASLPLSPTILLSLPPSTGIARVCCHVPCFLCRSGGSKLRSLRLYWMDGLTYAPFSLAQLSVFWWSSTYPAVCHCYIFLVCWPFHFTVSFMFIVTL